MLATDFLVDHLDGGKPTFEQVYGEWFHEVSRWARAQGGLSADLDDLTQEVFLVVRRKLPQFDGANLKGWLYRITQRTVRDYRRRAWFRRLARRLVLSPEALETLEDSDGADPFEHLQRTEDLKRLEHVLSRMTDRRRRVFILFEIEGYSGDEIASLEGIPVNTVWARLHHARRDFLSFSGTTTTASRAKEAP